VEEGRDHVRLTLPAAPAFVRLARMAAASLASRMGFSYDHIEDLRLAVDELCFTLTGSRGRPGRIQLVYTILPDALLIEGEGPSAEGTSGPPPVTDLSRQILDALVDEHEVGGNTTTVHFRMVKRIDEKS
jgi:hypothetical protein